MPRPERRRAIARAVARTIASVWASSCFSGCHAHTHGELAEAVAARSRGHTYARLDGPEVERAVLGCPVYFDAALRSRWFAISGQRYYVDAVGRPLRAVAALPPISADDPRDAGCQRDVGHWGEAAAAPGDYDGGHMIGYQLGGWSGRANLVPQQLGFNRGRWKQLEDALAGCRALDARRLQLTVWVDYANDDALVPIRMAMRIDDTATGDAIMLVVDNQPHGGPDGGATTARGIAWLRDLGCVGR